MYSMLQSYKHICNQFMHAPLAAHACHEEHIVLAALRFLGNRTRSL
jgi:hypothetical protein